jgi:hypothetical protein
MKYATYVGSGAIMYVHTKFHRECFRHSEVNKERFRDTDTHTHTHTHRGHGNPINLL